MSVLKINKTNIEELKQSDKPLLIDFYAEWCGPCRMISKVIDEIANEREDILVGKVNVEEERELAEEFGVMSIPTIVVMKDEKVVNQSTGVRPKAQILTMI